MTLRIGHIEDVVAGQAQQRVDEQHVRVDIDNAERQQGADEDHDVIALGQIDAEKRDQIRGHTSEDIAMLAGQRRKPGSYRSRTA